MIQCLKLTSLRLFIELLSDKVNKRERSDMRQNAQQLTGRLFSSSEVRKRSTFVEARDCRARALQYIAFTPDVLARKAALYYLKQSGIVQQIRQIQVMPQPVSQLLRSEPGNIRQDINTPVSAHRTCIGRLEDNHVGKKVRLYGRCISVSGICVHIDTYVSSSGSIW